MKTNQIIVNKINLVKRASILAVKPYIPITARATHALAIILTGNLKYSAKDEQVVVKSGQMLFIRSGYIDCTETFECDECEFMTVDFGTANDDFELEYVIDLGNQRDAIMRLYEQSCSIWSAGMPNHQMKCFELLYGILNRLFESTHAEQVFFEKYRKIADGISMLNRRYSDSSLSVSELAAVCRMSESNLNRLIHELYGCSTFGLMRRTRIQNAQNLLVNSENRIGEVAVQVGYTDIYSFSHAFKLVVGCSPSEWRLKRETGTVFNNN